MSKRPTWPKRPFFDLEPDQAAYEAAKSVIIPAPYEGTVSFGQGTAQGPLAVLRASWQVELYDVMLKRELHEQGIHGRRPLSLPEDPEDAVRAVREAVGVELERGKRPVLLGGEHTLSVGAVAAARERFPGLCVLQLDAHADLRDSYGGTKYSHACVMRRLAEMGIPLVPVGIRSMCLEEAEWAERQGLRMFYAHVIKKDRRWVKRVLERLAERVYLTLDIDVLDPAEMPATGTPEPGGLSYYELLELLHALGGANIEVVAVDLMEFAPLKGLHAADFLAAKILYQLCTL